MGINSLRSKLISVPFVVGFTSVMVHSQYGLLSGSNRLNTTGVEGQKNVLQLHEGR